MRPTSINCPSCSAPISHLRAEILTCGHCGRTVKMPSSPRERGRAKGPPPASPSLGAILWRRTRPYSRAGVMLLAVACALLAGQLVRSFFTFTERSRYGDEAILAGVLLGVSSLLVLATGRKGMAILAATIGGGLLIAKPLYYPMWSVYGENGRLFRLASETHLNFLVPGCLLLGLALLLVLTLRPRR